MITFVPYPRTVILKSAAVWVGQLAGALGLVVFWLQSLSADDAAALHAQGFIHWLPLVISFLGNVISPIARGVQQNLTPDVPATPPAKPGEFST